MKIRNTISRGEKRIWIRCLPIWCNVSIHWSTFLSETIVLTCHTTPCISSSFPESCIGWPSSAMTGVMRNFPLPRIGTSSWHFAFNVPYFSLCILISSDKQESYDRGQQKEKWQTSFHANKWSNWNMIGHLNCPS